MRFLENRERSKVMSERTKLLKRAVMASVGASSNVERIKAALSDAMQDLVKVAGDLIDDLEDKGKVKTETVQVFLRNVQDEATKRTQDAEKKLSSKVGVGTRKAAKEFGLATRDEVEDILERLHALEESVHGHSGDEPEGDGRKGRKKKSEAGQ
jgi:polyhydroxyalkanoate synthesis regulator phasin